ncbi:MAG: 4,5-dihydroxyphthalate decarboxylase [Chloroflexi bacterium]|nr:4,5-dihydroxyphthalate decarboxylase [Chloroflexota bacterium]
MPAAWTRAISEGRIGITGVTFEQVSRLDFAPARFDQAERGLELGENGIRRAIGAVLAGAPAVGIPVFLTREHMQRNLLVLRDSPIKEPRDLIGKRIGSWLEITSGSGAGVALLLEQAYGIPLDQIEWHMGNPPPTYSNRMNVKVVGHALTPDQHFERLVRGDIDAFLSTTGPRYFSMFGGGDPVYGRYAESHLVRPIMADPAMMADAYRRTGLYPITDITIVSPEVAAEHPALLLQLIDAFSEANALASEYRDSEENALAEEQLRLFGDDPHVYCLNANQRKNLVDFIDILYRLGGIERIVEPEALFVPSTINRAPGDCPRVS